MISVIVTYKVKKDFVGRNKTNIQKFITDFEQLNTSLFQYNVFTKQDGITFVHHSLYKNEDIQKDVLNTASFVRFQKERDTLGLDEKPEIEFINLVAATKHQ
ncbi:MULTISPECIES: hypothetical protein [Galbibacter]|uniref:ABM domain-containing protein n=1 Tax=Galbibacter pacificus TaxID=2996052 RepID=A0ABT6FV05_9FLAO|nr:hypothetical protein [Galbibacter pacificus]MDG3583423.1 hypothetical protein [Galbibacter pacificus]MDG3587100.1 hypothetical protein [Galbibacter pacificus]